MFASIENLLERPLAASLDAMHHVESDVPLHLSTNLCPWAYFVPHHAKYIINNIDTIKFCCGQIMFGYEDAMKSDFYQKKWGKTPPKEHCLTRAIIDNFLKRQTKSIVVVPPPVLEPSYPRYIYSFDTVRSDSLMVSLGGSGKMVTYLGQTMFLEFVDKSQITPQRVPILERDPVFQKMCYDYEIRKMEETILKYGFRDPAVYSKYQWEYSLYSYSYHKEVAASIERAIAKEKALVPGDGIGLLSNFSSSDSFPSPYSLGPVSPKSISEVISQWNDEVLVLMYVSIFLTKEDWDIINEKNNARRVIIVDVGYVPLRNGIEMAPGIMVRNISNRISGTTDVYSFTDPPFTENLLTFKDTFHLSGWGRAVEYLSKMVPGRKYTCDTTVELQLKTKGLVVRGTDKVPGVRLLETFDHWFKYKKGYFVPAGKVNPSVISIRKPLPVYRTRTIYHYNGHLDLSKEYSLALTAVFGACRYFCFSRALTCGNFFVTDNQVPRGIPWLADRVGNKFVLTPTSGVGVIFDISTKTTFHDELLNYKQELSAREWHKLIEFIRCQDWQDIREWINERF